MRPRSAAVIATRVIALWVGIEALTTIVSLIVLLSESGQGSGTASLWAIIVARALIAFFLWTQAESFGTAIARGTVDEGPAEPGRAANTHAVAFSVVGLIFVINAITGLVSTAASEVQYRTLTPLVVRNFGGFGAGRGAEVIVEIVTLAIGLFLLLGSGSLARYLSRSYPEPEPPATPLPPGAGA